MSNENKKVCRTIDITPKWSGVIRPMLEILKNPEVPNSAKDVIEAEIIRLASYVDEIQSAK